MREKIKKVEGRYYKILGKIGFKLLELIRVVDIKSEDRLFIKIIKTLTLIGLCIMLLFLEIIVLGTHYLISLKSIIKTELEL